MKPVRRDQQGFTLFELLVVVSVLAAMAGIAAVAVDGYQSKAEEELVNVEMKRIASAIYRFKQDTGVFPKESNFSADTVFGSASSHEKTIYSDSQNLSWLFTAPKNSAGDEVMPFNVNTGQGWNGPYLTMDSSSRFLEGKCFVETFDLEASDITYLAVEDVFNRTKKYEATILEDCFILRKNSRWTGRDSSGNPYQYQTGFTNNDYPDCPGSGNGCVVLLSAGPDGSFSATPGDGDDIVKILGVNP